MGRRRPRAFRCFYARYGDGKDSLIAVKQGDIYYVISKDFDVDGSEQRNDRPYVIVSRDLVNNQGNVVIGVPLTSKLHKANSYRVMIPAQQMIKDISSTRPLKDSVALCDHIRVLDPKRLVIPKMGSLTQTAIGGVELGLAYVLDIR